MHMLPLFNISWTPKKYEDILKWKSWLKTHIGYGFLLEKHSVLI